MKMLLVTAILLIIAQSMISAALGRPKREEENLEIPDEKKDRFVEIFNKARKEMAKALQISNMHKLEALQILDKFAQDTIIGCLDPVQTEIACIVRKCGEKNDILVNCICGPENGFSKSNVKKGDPGSDCDGDDDDGLCDDSSSTHAAAGIVINLIAFYLLASSVF